MNSDRSEIIRVTYPLDMCKRAVEDMPWLLEFISDQFKTEEMCFEAVEEDPEVLEHIPEKFKTEVMCIKAVEGDPDALEYVPDKFKTKEMCFETVEEESESLVFVPDWFFYENMVTESTMDLLESFHERKAHKENIKEELAPVAWHPSRAWDWCFDEKQKIRWLGSEKYTIKYELFD